MTIAECILNKLVFVNEADIVDEVMKNPNFKKWFGRSVVTQNGKPGGKPLVCYHGTPTGGFTKFSKEKQGTNTFHKSGEVGFHFTDDKADANIVSRVKWIDKKSVERPQSPSVYPVFLCITNPFIKNTPTITKETIDDAKSKRCDGIIVPTGIGTAKEYVVFEPTQIKSVYNKGTFSKNNPDIMESLNDAYPYKMDYANGTVGGKFTTSDGILYDAGIAPLSLYDYDFPDDVVKKLRKYKYMDADGKVRVWNVAFLADKQGKVSFDIIKLKQGEVFKVFATLVRIFRNAIKRLVPQLLYFTAEGASRQRLYDRFVKLIQTQLGYKLFAVWGGSTKSYLLNRK